MNTDLSNSQCTQLCSEKTLQVSREGFFLDFVRYVADIVGESWIRNSFGKLKTDRERIYRIYQDQRIGDHVRGFLSNVQEVYRKKCLETSKTRYKEAESCKENRKATILYSQSILKSPVTSENFALSLLGRSKTLLSMERYSNALSDVQLCLKGNLPDSSRWEAFWVMAVCCKVLGNNNKATISFSLAEKLSGRNQKSLKTIQDSMQRQYNIVDETIKVLPKMVGVRHEQFQNASNKLKLKSSDDLGRHFIAREEIKSGEVLVVETPQVACLSVEKFGTHCQHCFERLISPVCCPDCSSVAFCKLECRDVALSTYHRYECKFLDLLFGSGMSVLSHTALRIITQNPLSRILEIYKDKSKDRLYSLCTNSSGRSPEDFLQRTLMAAFLLRCLQKSSYFGEDRPSVDPKEQEYQVGEMLLFYLQMLQFNAHEVCENLYSEEHRLKEARMSSLGVAVFPTVALFNHDCCPSVSRYFVGKTIVITSIKPLKPDEVVSENYGPIFTRMKLKDRQRSLSARYWFDCQCTACAQDWPTLESGPNSGKNRVRCPTSNCSHVFCFPAAIDPIKCPQCENEVCLEANVKELKGCEEQYEIAGKLIEWKETQEAVKVLCSALDTFYKVSTPPHRPTHLAQEDLRVCLMNSGNTFDCPIKRNN